MKFLFKRLIKLTLLNKIRFYIDKLNKINNTQVRNDIKVLFVLRKIQNLGYFKPVLHTTGKLDYLKSKIVINLYYYLKNKSKYVNAIIPHLVCHYYLIVTSDIQELNKMFTYRNKHTDKFLQLCLQLKDNIHDKTIKISENYIDIILDKLILEYKK